MRRILAVIVKSSGPVALAGAAVLLLAAFGVDRLLGQEVLLVAPHSEATVRLNRSLYLPGDPVAEIYGNPLSRPVRVVLTSEREVIRPEEEPNLALLENGNGRHPLQVQTVWFLARSGAATLLGIALGGALARLAW